MQLMAVDARQTADLSTLLPRPLTSSAHVAGSVTLCPAVKQTFTVDGAGGFLSLPSLALLKSALISLERVEEKKSLRMLLTFFGFVH